MKNKTFVTTMALLLVLAYLGALAVSTAHLSQLYALFGGGLPYGVSIGLAVALETVAFLFSIISTSLGKETGPWPAWASTSALTLVWAGNGYAMLLAAPTQPLFVTVIASCFVPVCTLMVGKVLGSLFSLLDRLTQRDLAERQTAQRREQHAQPCPTTTTGLPSFQTPGVGTESVLNSSPSKSDERTDRVTPETSGAPEIEQQPRPLAVVEQAQQQPIWPIHSAPEQEIQDPVVLEPIAGVGTPQPDMLPSTSKPAEPGSLEFGSPNSGQGHNTLKIPVPESEPVPDTTALVPESDPVLDTAALVPESPQSTEAKSPPPRKEKLDLTGIGVCSDQALERVGLSRAELDRLADLVAEKWPPTSTPRLLTAKQGVLTWAYTKAGASKTGLAAELGIGKKEWVVRDIAKSVKAVLEAVRTPNEVNPPPAETLHGRLPGQQQKHPEAAAGGDFSLPGSELPVSTSSNGPVEP